MDEIAEIELAIIQELNLRGLGLVEWAGLYMDRDWRYSVIFPNDEEGKVVISLVPDGSNNAIWLTFDIADPKFTIDAIVKFITDNNSAVRWRLGTWLNL